MSIRENYNISDDLREELTSHKKEIHQLLDQMIQNTYKPLKNDGNQLSDKSLLYEMICVLLDETIVGADTLIWSSRNRKLKSLMKEGLITEKEAEWEKELQGW